jgi:O-acetyl-ADP-ribose deacetylase (regulator of RNase III)
MHECLKIAEESNLSTIVFPAISCGAYGFPIPAAATVAISTVFSFFQKNPTLRVIFACYNEKVRKAHGVALEDHIREGLRR